MPKITSVPRSAANDQSINTWDRLKDPEAAFVGLGPVGADAPPMHTWKGEPGKAAAQAIEFLLTSVEQRGMYAPTTRTLLAGCYADKSRPVDQLLLHCLDEIHLQAMMAVQFWVGVAGGLRLTDFPDGGERYMRHVLRMRQHTIARTLAARAA